MANEVRIVVTGDSKDAEAALKRASMSFDDFAKKARGVGLALSAIGAVGIAAFGASIHSAIEEQRGINLLDQALRNVGRSYKEVAGQIEDLIEAQQFKTNYGDEQQREALQQLVALSGDYENSLAALPAVLDLAAGLHIDLGTAAMLVGRGLAGNTEMFARYGLEISKGASETAILEAITRKFGGSAEAASDPVTRLKNRLGDVFQLLGAALLPTIEVVATALEGFARLLQGLDPTIVKVIAVVAGLVTVIAAIAGPLLIAISLIPSLVAGIHLVNAAFALMAANPVVLAIAAVVLAIAALGVGLYLLWKNWDTVWGWIKGHTVIVVAVLTALFGPLALAFAGLVKVGFWFKDHWRDIWEAIKDVAGNAAEFIKGVFRSVAATIEGIWNSIAKRVNSLPKVALPGILGGGEFGFPTLPELTLPSFKYGGTVPGPVGAPVMAMLHGGEKVSPVGASGVTIQSMTINASSEEGGRAAARGLIAELRLLEMTGRTRTQVTR